MATASATTIRAATVVGPMRSPQRRAKVKYIKGLNPFCGLKPINNVTSLGLPICSEQSFAKLVISIKKQSSKGGGGGGGALAATCNAITEIFRIAATMPALVLVGVAVGFVLLRVEAAVEEE